jgi:hypothetical protein
LIASYVGPFLDGLDLLAVLKLLSSFYQHLKNVNKKIEIGIDKKK